MNAKHRRTLQAIFARPTRVNIPFADIEALFAAIGAHIQEREGSRIKITLREMWWHAHRPHPGKNARKYQVEEARERLTKLGITS
jgi:hypothetical protein